MWRLIAVFSLFMVLTGPARAAEDKPEVYTSPICSTVYNQAPYKVRGHIATNFFTRPDGIRTRHRENFVIEPDKRIQFCSTGPFYPDERLEITLRTLIPVFSCKTKIDQEIVVKGRYKPEGGAETFALCR